MLVFAKAVRRKDANVKLKKILVPTDFSDSSAAALELAMCLARDHDATLLIVHVRENPGGVGEGQAAVNKDEAYLHRLLQEAGRRAAGIGCSRHLLEGDPGEQIVKFAEQQQVDLIALGTHGRRGIVRWLMGSVAESVVRRASCPVLTIKHVVKPQPQDSPAAG